MRCISLIVVGAAIMTVSGPLVGQSADSKRYELLIAHMDIGWGPDTLFRIDTYTGEVDYLAFTNIPVPQSKQSDLAGKSMRCEGWMSVAKTLIEAGEDAQKLIDSLPEKRSK